MLIKGKEYPVEEGPSIELMKVGEIKVHVYDVIGELTLGVTSICEKSRVVRGMTAFDVRQPFELTYGPTGAVFCLCP